MLIAQMKKRLPDRRRQLRLETLEQRNLLTTGSISGTVFEDLNGNGVQDAGEDGMPDSTVAIARTDPLLAIGNPDPDAEDLFGFHMASMGNTLLVGANHDDAGGVTGVGTAYLYDLDPASPTYGDLLKTYSNPDPLENDQFGSSVALDGDKVFVGTRRAWDSSRVGVAYLFDNLGGIITLTDPTQDFTPGATQYDTEGFGAGEGGVAIWNDRVYVGDARDDNSMGDEVGAVYIFDTSDGSLTGVLYSPNPEYDSCFGEGITIVGNTLLVAAPSDDTLGTDSGAVYVFDLESGRYLSTILNPSPDPGDYFGKGMAAFGDNVLISAWHDDTDGPDAGVFYLFDSSTGQLLRTFHTPRPQELAFSRWLTTDGNLIAASSRTVVDNVSDSGTAYVFDGASGQLVTTIENPTPETRDGFSRWGAFLDNGNFVISCATG